MIVPKPAHRAREPGLWGRLPLLMAMLAIAMQCFVLAPHVHAAGPAGEAALSNHAHADDAQSALACATCRVAASARIHTAPPEIGLTPPPARAALMAPCASDQSVRLTPAPAWRSRAPPLSLR